MEKQKRASVKRREKPGTVDRTNDETAVTTPQPSEPDEDLKEKRRSLLMMWESYADGEGPGPENKMDSEEKRKTFGYDRMMEEAAQSDVSMVITPHKTKVCVTQCNVTYKTKACVTVTQYFYFYPLVCFE